MGQERLHRDELESRFHRAMLDIFQRAKQEAGYNATRFLQMVSEHGGLAAARQLLRSPVVSEGFTSLWEKRRLDLSVEYHVLLPEFADLFDEDELEIARDRLETYGFRGGQVEG